MPRLRALFALFLAATWCSAAWHVDLEGVGMMFEHEHHSHNPDDIHHPPIGVPHDDHAQVYSRDVAKDQIRVGAAVIIWFALLGLATWLTAALRPTLAVLTSLRARRETDPPLAQVWQFLTRCAPDSAAPPASG